MNIIVQSHNDLRKLLWAEAWRVVARAEDTKEPHIATNWADSFLADFDARFRDRS